jgi:hypothetical protein
MRDLELLPLERRDGYCGSGQDPLSRYLDTFIATRAIKP